MISIIKKSVGIFSIIIFFIGCKTIPCRNTFLTPAFIGFSPSDIDTIIIRQYKKNDNFFHLLDTTLITNNPHIAYYSTSHDTTIIVLNVISGEEKYIFPDNDWQVYIPAKNKTVSISTINSPQTSYKCFGDNCGCTNPIDSFIQDGVTTIPQSKDVPYFGTTYLLYIN